MILLPAIDIRNGKAVRLEQGRFERETVYVDDPLEAARDWARAGARFLHVVDLDGAREGEPANLEHLRRITSELDLPVQYGGGLRSLVAVREALAAGATRVVVGTAAYTDLELVESLVRTWGGRVLIAIDVREGHVSVAGWTKETQMLPEEVIERMQRQGVKPLRLHQRGPRRDARRPRPRRGAPHRRRRQGTVPLSGGIGSLHDLAALASLRLVNLAGVISGKALYEKRFTVAEGQAALEES